MKRYLSLICILSVLVTSFVAPVRAADLSTEFIDLLEFSSVDHMGNFFYFQSEKEISLALPAQTNLYYVDILFTGAGITGIDALWSTYSKSLTIISVGDNLYRAYGSVPDGNYLELRLLFKNNGSIYSYITLLSCRVSTINVSVFDSDCYCGIATVDYGASIHYVPTDEINYRNFTGTSDPYLSTYRLDLYNLNWRKYDYVDYLVFLSVDSISSVSCTFGGQDVPFSISYIETDTTPSTDYLISIRVDCRNLNRAIDDYPFVSITGNVILDSANLVSVMNCSGIISQEVDIYAALLRKISLAIYDNFYQLYYWFQDQTNSIVAAINGDSSVAEQMQQNVNQKADELEELSGVMNSVNKPNIDSVNVSADNFIDQNILAVSMSGLSSVLSMPIFSDVFIMALTLATAGYVLFGKR